MSWDFPIFLDTLQTSQAWCKFRPISDFMVTSTSSHCPLLISEVVSEENESDRFRMLIQAIAVARAGQYLMKPGEEFFVVGIYLRANLIAERFVVAQIESDEGLARTRSGKKVAQTRSGRGVPDTESRTKVRFCVHRTLLSFLWKYQVSIAQRDFDLSKEDDAVSFLREMYNLATMFKDLSDKLDPEKNSCLIKIKAAATKVISLTKMARQNKSVSRSLAPVPEGREPGGAEDDLGVFGADDIQAVLKSMKYQVDFVLFGVRVIGTCGRCDTENTPCSIHLLP
jgi:hypothetical protein